MINKINKIRHRSTFVQGFLVLFLDIGEFRVPVVHCKVVNLKHTLRDVESHVYLLGDPWLCQG